MSGFPAREIARAKLTRSLRVVGVRDDGYHLIDAEMISIGLADELFFDEGDSLTVVPLTLPGRGVDSSLEASVGEAVPADSNNLVARALGVAGLVAAVRLVKNIPAGAGLGGGSADAGAVLRWAGISDHDVAASLGADVPFCLAGGAARVRGIGEIVDPIEVPEIEVALLTPPFGVSTVAVYREWDRLGGPTSSGRNDLELAALSVEPRLDRWRDRLGELTGCEPILAGSGSTWFVELEGPTDGSAVEDRLSEERLILAREGALLTLTRTGS